LSTKVEKCKQKKGIKRAE
jgi:hypothetical protein